MAFTIDQVPEDVQWVWCIQMIFQQTKMGVGLETYNKAQRIINNHPEWFPSDPKEEIPLSKNRLMELNGSV